MYPQQLNELSWRMEIVLSFEGGVGTIIRDWWDLVSVQEQFCHHPSCHGKTIEGENFNSDIGWSFPVFANE
jgi:hypothetical protein